MNINEDNSPLLEVLEYGADNAIKREDLAKYFNTNVRNISREIKRLRSKGYPVLAKRDGEGGIYLSNDYNEILAYTKSVRCEADRRYKDCNAMEHYLIYELGIDDSFQINIKELLIPDNRDKKSSLTRMTE